MEDKEKIQPEPVLVNGGKKPRPSRINADGTVMKQKRLSQFQWGELISFLKMGRHTQVELAEMYGITTQAITARRRALGGIEIGSHSIDKTSLTKVTQDKEVVAALKQIKGFTPAQAADLITENKKNAYLRNEQLGKIAHHLMLSSTKDKRLGSIKDEVKVLVDLQLIFEKELRLAGICLGFKDNNFDSIEDLPSITITKMNNKDIEAAQQRMSEDPEDAEEASYRSADDGIDDDEI